MRLYKILIALLFCWGVAGAQSITQELFKLNSKYSEFKSFSSLTKVTYLDSLGMVVETQKGKYVQYDKNSQYILGPYEVLSFDKELLQLNHNDSIAVFLLGQGAKKETEKSLKEYLKKVENYLTISKDTSITEVNGIKTINVELEYPVDFVVGMSVSFSKDYSLSKMEIKLSNKESIRFEYFNISFDKNKISKSFKRNDYLRGTGANAQLQSKYANYKFNNFSTQQ